MKFNQIYKKKHGILSYQIISIIRLFFIRYIFIVYTKLEA